MRDTEREREMNKKTQRERLVRQQRGEEEERETVREGRGKRTRHSENQQLCLIFFRVPDGVMHIHALAQVGPPVALRTNLVQQTAPASPQLVAMGHAG